MRRGEWEEGHSEAFERAEPGLKPKSQNQIYFRLTSSNNSTFLFSCWDKIAILQIPNLSFTSGMATALKVEQVIQSILVQDTEPQVVLDALIGV